MGSFPKRLEPNAPPTPPPQRPFFCVGTPEEKTPSSADRLHKDVGRSEAQMSPTLRALTVVTPGEVVRFGWFCLLF